MLTTMMPYYSCWMVLRAVDLIFNQIYSNAAVRLFFTIYVGTTHAQRYAWPYARSCAVDNVASNAAGSMPCPLQALSLATEHLNMLKVLFILHQHLQMLGMPHHHPCLLLLILVLSSSSSCCSAGSADAFEGSALTGSWSGA
jgi:hypothetical protein